MSDGANIYLYKAVEENPFSPRQTETLDLASRGSRLGASLIDSLIWAVPMTVIAIIMGVLSISDDFVSNLSMILTVAVIPVLAIMIVQIVFLVKYSQTIGKRALGIAIYAYDEDARATAGRVIGLRLVVNGLIACIPYIGSIYGLVDTLFIFSDERRCLHDRIANTRVVKLPKMGASE